MQHLAVALLTLALLAAPLPADAQPAGKVWRIGFLRADQPPPKDFLEAFQQGLRELGYVNGENVVVDVRFTDGGVNQLPQLAEALVRSKVDVIVASASQAALAAKRATTSVPIVCVGVVDPVELGLVRTLGRPGGNITGLASNAAEMAGKRLELLTELVPRLRRVAVLWHVTNPTSLMALKEAEVAARAAGVRVTSVPVQGPNDFDPAFKAVSSADGLIQIDDTLFMAHRAQLAGLAVRSRLPVIHGAKEFVEAGGLMSYGTNFSVLYRRAATYVDKILKGAKPADLPIEQPTKFELVINLKTAKAIGLTSPPSVLARADEIIE